MISTTHTILLSIVQGVFVLAFAPLVIGVMRKVKARLQGRIGAPLFQAYSDVYKFIQKDSVVSTQTSWVFTLAPYMVFGTAAAAAFLLPQFTTLGAQVDIIFVGFLLVLGTVFLVLTGLDAATTFGGMGSSREAMISALSEPVFITAIFALAVAGHSTFPTDIISTFFASPQAWLNPAIGLVFLSLFLITLAENARYPFDNPTTHLELTMVHEAMILENSGKNLALMEVGSMTKLTVLLSILASIVLPWGIATQLTATAFAIGIGTWVAKILLFAVIIAVIESTIAKMRLLRVPALLGMGWVVAFVALITQFFFV